MQTENTNQSSPEKQKFGWFEIVENEWREEYDREGGLGIVVVASEENHYWVAKIQKDEKGYFIVPDVAYRSANQLKKTNFKIKDIPIVLEKETKS